MRSLLALVVALVACAPTVTDDPQPACDVEAEPAITLPAACWEEPWCAPETEAEERCGRAYVCDHEQVDGTFEPVCVTAYDCACLDELETRCDVDVWRPAFCDF